MPHDLEKILIYHITDVANLPGILAEGGLLSDAIMAKRNPETSPTLFQNLVESADSTNRQNF